MSVAGWAEHLAVGRGGGSAVLVGDDVIGLAPVGGGLAAGMGADAVSDDEPFAQFASEQAGRFRDGEVEIGEVEGDPADGAGDGGEERGA